MKPKPKITIILAGGKARRFGGQDKGEILIGGERLIDIICDRLKSQSTEVMISATHDYGLGLTTIADIDNAPGGPVGGIYSIWKSLKSRNVEGFFTVPVDGPNLPDDLVSNLYSDANSAIATDELGWHPTYAWWRMADLARVWEHMDLAKSISLNKLADLAKAQEIVWEREDCFVNINYPSDLENL